MEKIDYFEKLHRLTADELREDKDWREMSDDEWDKMLEKIDKFIDDFKERIRQLLKEKLKDDRSKTQVLEFTKLNLLEMTRKHMYSNLEEI